MKNIDDKVKDIVDVRSFLRLIDFQADPARTLGRYHFTDVTSDLMAKWLDRIANLDGQQGPAFALAGYRGVGKSHFLGALGAIVSQPELRSRITDAHVLASAQRLRRRHYPIANVRRGTRETLFEELKDALGEALGMEPASLGDDLLPILQLASEKAGDVPFVLIIDTAFERDMRVSRDDGTFLSEIAEAAASCNVFLGIALDDDISDADGINAAIVRSFIIDFLDQEHLYKIVASYIFPKQPQKQETLHQIYDYFRGVLPGFRWSEQKFTSLYPVHPVILEVTPFVRFYVHDFALLGFAADAGAKVLSRPATSLISLDEVFSSVEESLRKAEDLKEAFIAFDKLNDEVVRKLPIMNRLNAKLILTALLILSLDGEVKSAEDIRSAMLIIDERDPAKSAKYVSDILESFAAALPGAIHRVSEDGRDTKYSFKLSIKDDLNTALAGAIAEVSPDAVPKILRRSMRERFSDCTLLDEDDNDKLDWMDCQITWRGGLRKGRLFWHTATAQAADVALKGSAELIDWEVVVDLEPGADPTDTSNAEKSRVVWKPGTLTLEDTETIYRFHVLLSNAQLREDFHAQIRSSLHAHKIAVDKIFQRSFLDDGSLVIEGKESKFTEEARGVDRLSELFSVMLAPMFDRRYPDHPTFDQTLGMNEVSLLATEFFSGGGQNSVEVQQLAETFSLPLGLAVRRGELYVPESEENLTALPIAAEILRLVDDAPDTVVPMKAVYRHLKDSGQGLVREAQHLILTALVSRRQIEFVTSKGDRISRRSLDLKIIWGDIVGIARPAGRNYSGEKLAHWVTTLCGKSLPSTKNGSDDLTAIKALLGEWISDWKRRRVLERFNELPDEILNTKIWRLSMHAKNSFGTVADTVEAVLDDSMPIDEGLHRIADAFSDSKEEFERRSENLVTIEDFINGAARREEIRTYLSISEATDIEAIETLREELSRIIDASYYNPSDKFNRELEDRWTQFRDQFAEQFAVKHDMVMRSHFLQEKVNEIQRGDSWWEFENLASIPVVQHSYWKEAKRICREFRQLDCQFDIREMLQIHPFCACSFSLARTEYWERLPQRLTETIEKGLTSYRETFVQHSDTVIPMLEDFANSIEDVASASAAEELIAMMSQQKEFRQFTTRELQVLQRIFEKARAPEMVIEVSPDSINVVDDGEYSGKLAGVTEQLEDDSMLVSH